MMALEESKKVCACGRDAEVYITECLAWVCRVCHRQLVATNSKRVLSPREPLWNPPYCEACQFVGTSTDHDVYVCIGPASSSSLGGSILAKYGNKEEEYVSMPLVVAAKLAFRLLGSL